MPPPGSYWNTPGCVHHSYPRLQETRPPQPQICFPPRLCPVSAPDTVTSPTSDNYVTTAPVVWAKRDVIHGTKCQNASPCRDGRTDSFLLFTSGTRLSGSPFSRSLWKDEKRHPGTKPPSHPRRPPGPPAHPVPATVRSSAHWFKPTSPRWHPNPGSPPRPLGLPKVKRGVSLLPLNSCFSGCESKDKGRA